MLIASNIFLFGTLILKVSDDGGLQACVYLRLQLFIDNWLNLMLCYFNQTNTGSLRHCFLMFILRKITELFVVVVLFLAYVLFECTITQNLQHL